MGCLVGFKVVGNVGEDVGDNVVGVYVVGKVGEPVGVCVVG